MWQNKRSEEQEILDLGDYSDSEYESCLHLLGKVNEVLGGFSATKKAMLRLKETPNSILDIGCGGGQLCQKLHGWFPKAKIVGIDISQKAVEYAERLLPTSCKERVTFVLQKDKSLPYGDNSFDVVTTMLVCHHMSDDELVLFLKESFRISSMAVVVNDLHRHILAYIGFSLIAPFIFLNRLIWHDGRLSIRRSFQKNDWISFLERAGFQKRQYSLTWNFPFRWTLTLTKQ